MNSNYAKVAASLCMIMSFTWNAAISSAPTFIDCTQDPVLLCTQDAGVRLPANNQLFLGESHPDATSCSIHISRQAKVQTNCPGELTYEVNIYLFESSDPILLQATTTVVPDSLFEAVLSFDSETAADEVIKLNGIPYTTGCERYHRIIWTVTDACGETSVCEMRIDVYDCSPPVHSSNALQILFGTSAGYMDLRLSDFTIPSIDDCTSSGNYLYSFSPDAYIPDSLFYVCDLPQGQEIEFPIWIADEGRDVNCDSLIEWSERQVTQHYIFVVFTSGNFNCDTIDCYFFANVLDQAGSGIKNVQVTVSNNNQSSTYVTNSSGQVMTVFWPPPPVTVELSKTDFHKNGVSTLDNVIIMKHLLGIQRITNPFKIIAADVNTSYSVTAIDLIINRKMILGIIEEYPGGKSWKFFNENHVFPDIMEPWVPIAGQDTIHTCESQAPDFIGVKLGDLNNTAVPNANSLLPRNDYPSVNWVASYQQYKKDEEIEIPIYAGDFKSLQGFQLTISSGDLDFLGVHSNIIELEESYALFGNHLTMSWMDLNGIHLQDDDVLFTIKAKALHHGNLKETLSLNSDKTNAELYTIDDEIFIPRLIVSSDTDLQIFFPSPNPWKESTSIPFHLNASGLVQLDIMDIDGKILYSNNEYFLQGNNHLKIDATDIAYHGMMIYLIKSGDQIVTGKMVRM